MQCKNEFGGEDILSTIFHFINQGISSNYKQNGVSSVLTEYGNTIPVKTNEMSNRNTEGNNVLLIFILEFNLFSSF